VALLANVLGNQHAPEFSANRSKDLWPHLTPDVPVAPGRLRLAVQHHWTVRGPRAALAAGIRKIAETQADRDRTGWLSPEAMDAWEHPLPAEHELSPAERAQRYRAQQARTQMRRMLAEGEAGDIVIIDSGSSPRVTGVPVDHTFVVHAYEHPVWEDFEAQTGPPWPRRAPLKAALLLADRIGQPPAGPWALVITQAVPAEGDRDFLDAVRDEMHVLGVTGLSDLTDIIFIPSHQDLYIGRWRRQTHPLEPGGPAYAFRPGGVVTTGLGDLLTGVIRAVHAEEGAPDES
jgi:hypothetical protein